MAIRAVNHFLIEAKDTHKKKEGSIILIERFENQNKANQVFPVHSVSMVSDFSQNVEEGDNLIIHFNIVVHDYDQNGSKKRSKYYIKDDIFYVPENMIHGVIRKDGEIRMNEEWNLILPIKKEEEEKTSSGIITKLNNDKQKMKKDIMYGYIVASNRVPVGTKVVLDNHSDYEITVPNLGDHWLVKDNMILAIDED